MTNQDPDNLDNRLDALRDKLNANKQSAAKKNAQTGPKQGWAEGLKLGSEFVAGILVGAGIGYVFDGFFDTSPWGFIAFFMLGFAAGVLNVLRSVGAVAQPLDKK